MMKHYFLVNPVAGKGKSLKTAENIRRYYDGHGLDYEIITTEQAHIGKEIAHNIAVSGEKCRIYAVGGDGTLFDIINGAAGFDNVSVGVIPCGSGNDFVKSFGAFDKFTDIAEQCEGGEIPIDLIKFEDNYCVNIASMGMDAEVVNHHNRHRILSKINGTFSYTFSVFTAFIFNMNDHFRIVADGEEIDGTFLFVIVSNGRYYGGGFNPTPYAKLNSGKIELMLINEVSRAKVVKFMNIYREGKHLDIDWLYERRTVEKVEVFMDKYMSVQLDGEIFKRNHAVFEIVPKGINFVLPKSLTENLPDVLI